MKKTIAIDMDEVILDQNKKMIKLYEAEFGVRLTEDDFKGRKIYDTPEASHLRNHLFEKGFFRDIPVMENSPTILEWLQQHFTIVILTATTEFKYSMHDKHEWLQEHFPFISWKQYIFCGDKRFIKADYMIDDRASNLLKFDGKKLLYTAPHNFGETRFTRMNNWLEIREYFEKEV